MNGNVREKSQTRWVVKAKEKPDARVRLFCLPYAGGTAASFRGWQDALPGFIQSSPVQLPGRGERLLEPAFNYLPDLIEALGPALSLDFNKPFALFGHSMGAIIVFELTRWLRRTGNPMPVHLFVSGRRAPQLPDEKLPSIDLTEPEFMERLRELNGTPKEVLDHPELMRLMIPLLRADFAVCETYKYEVEPPLNCPVTVFGGLADNDVPRENLEPWREQTTASFSLHMFPGDHFFIHSSQNEIIRQIVEKLAVFANKAPLLR